LRLAVDIGGTFTDVVAYDEETGKTAFGKSPTTPAAMAEGVLAAVGKAGTNLKDCSAVLHGTTAVINALTERKGAKTALVTTKGFRDVYEIGRINRPDSYNLFFKKHVPLVPRYLRFEVDERLKGDGSVFIPFNEESADQVIAKIKENGIEAVAITFLHSYRNPVHETLMKDIIKEELGGKVYVTASNELSREYREYERTSTTVANAYVGPKMATYVDNLNRSLEKEGFKGNLLFMQSNGGIYDSEAAKIQPIQLLESGPAGGVAGTAYISHLLGFENAIALDMGGTTAKACTIERGIPSSGSDYFVGGYNSGLAIRIPVLDVVEVGAGGGSIARVDESGSMKVGPQSAGAVPGPAAYGKGGTEPTVTDADVVLGKIDPTRFLGGEIPLDRAKAEAAIREKIAKPLGVSLEAAAQGIVSIADATMAYAVRSVTTERGMDTRDFVMMIYGGAGPNHVAPVADELQVPLVIVPNHPAHFSAMGMLLSDVRRDYVQTYFGPVADMSLKDVEELYQKMEAKGRQEVLSSNVKVGEVTAIRSADMRYVGQEHAVLVQIPAKLATEEDRKEIKKRFDAAHQLRYSHSAPEEKAELVSLRLTMIGSVSKPALTVVQAKGKTPPNESMRGSRKVYFASTKAFVDTPIYSREKLLAGNMIEGPCVIEEYASNIPVPPEFTVEIEKHGNVYLRLRG
jgi:N-methylhydantoinase A